jgi:hypothetical protein
LKAEGIKKIDNFVLISKMQTSPSDQMLQKSQGKGDISRKMPQL